MIIKSFKKLFFCKVCIFIRLWKKMSCWENKNLNAQNTSHSTHKNTECHKDFENTENSRQKKRKSSSDHHLWLQESNMPVLSQNQNRRHLQKGLPEDLTKNPYLIGQLNHQIWQWWISFNNKMRAQELKNLRKNQDLKKTWDQSHLHSRWFSSNNMSSRWWSWK